MQIRVLHGGNRSVLSCWDVDRRPWDRVIWHHFCSNIYIKHHTIEKYLNETSNWRCILLLMSLKWLRKQGNCRPMREMVRKNILYLWFSHFTLTEHIGARIIPCCCISIKNNFQWGPRQPIYRQPKPSPDCGKRFKMCQITFISIHILANQNSYHDDEST